MTYSPLEALALSNISDEERRIGYIAYLCRTGRFGWEAKKNPLRQKEARRVISELREPWGNRAKAAAALQKEVDRQRTLIGKRYRRRSGGHSYRVSDYDPVWARECSRAENGEEGWSIEERTKAIALRRFGKAAKNLLPKGHCWTPRSVSNWAIKDARLRNGRVFMLIRPHHIRTNQGTDLCAHNVLHLAYKIGGHVGAVRVKHDVRSVDKAIESLKSGKVRAAEKAGSVATPDFVKGGFYLQSPRRRKPRFLPFKSYTRDRS